MRKSFDGLSGMVAEQMQQQVLGGDVFIFLEPAAQPGEAALLGKGWSGSIPQTTGEGHFRIATLR
jgi:hypothetical protein